MYTVYHNIVPDRQPSIAPRPRQSLLVLAGLVALQAAGPMPPFMTGALAVQIKEEIGFTDAVLGLLLAAYFLVFASLSPLSGRLVDTIGARKATWLAVAGTSTSLIGIATLGRSVPAIAAFLALAGAAGSVGLPTANRVIARALPDSRRGLSFGLKMAAVPVATLVAGASVPLIALNMGWRWAMAAVVVFPLSALTLQTMGARRFPDGYVGTSPDQRETAPVSPTLVLMVAGGFAGTVAAGAFNAFLIVASVDMGIELGTAGWIAAAASGAAVFTRPLYGWLADRRQLDGFRFSALLMVVGAAGFALLATGRAEFLVIAALVGHIAGWGWSGLFQMAVIETYPMAPAAATGAIAVGLALGQGLGPASFGFISSSGGYPMAWGVVSAAALVGAVFMSMAARSRRSAPLQLGLRSDQ